MKPVAVVILNWNGSEVLRRYLPSVIEHTPSSVADVIVVDNGSTDNSLQYLNNVEGIRVLPLLDNYGFSGGYNRAIEQLDYPYILLLNSDVRVSANWLEPLVDFITDHPEVVAVQPKILWDRDPSKYEYAGAEGGYMDRLGYPFCRGRIFDTLEDSVGQYGSEPKPVFWTSGAAMMVRRKAYLDHGGLDEEFFAHQEEIDLCWRWNCEGYQLYVVPESEVFHYGGASLDMENPRKTFLNFRNNLQMLHKLLPRKVLLWTMVRRFFLDRLAALVFLVRGKTGDALAVFKAWWAFWTNPRKRTGGIDRDKGYQKLYPKVLLWRYHIKGEKKYSHLEQ